ncbi:MAG: hypothetical protein P9E67_13930, partial [Candidatus Competibacter sp.]|nr:hypothetical protein [Candidatus Competibacter sp.]
DRALARALDRALDRDLDRDLALALDRARALALDRARALALDRARPFTSKDFSALRNLCCILIFSWVLMRDSYSNSKLTWYKQLWSKRTKDDFTRDAEQNLDAVFNLYAFSLLIDERRKGNLPAWEGIRIVRERSE